MNCSPSPSADKQVWTTKITVRNMKQTKNLCPFRLDDLPTSIAPARRAAPRQRPSRRRPPQWDTGVVPARLSPPRRRPASDRARGRRRRTGVVETQQETPRRRRAGPHQGRRHATVVPVWQTTLTAAPLMDAIRRISFFFFSSARAGEKKRCEKKRAKKM